MLKTNTGLPHIIRMDKDCVFSTNQKVVSRRFLYDLLSSSNSWKYFQAAAHTLTKELAWHHYPSNCESVLFKEATFRFSLIHKVSPQRVAPCVWFGRIFMSNALPDTKPQKICVSSRDQTREFLLIRQMCKPQYFRSSH